MTKEASTICDAFRYGSTLSEGGPCLGWRNTPLVPFLWLTYNETMLRAKNFGSGLLTLGLSPGENTRLGILARYKIIVCSCPEKPRRPKPQKENGLGTQFLLRTSYSLRLLI